MMYSNGGTINIAADYNSYPTNEILDISGESLETSWIILGIAVEIYDIQALRAFRWAKNSQKATTDCQQFTKLPPPTANS